VANGIVNPELKYGAVYEVTQAIQVITVQQHSMCKTSLNTFFVKIIKYLLLK
jgi:hypothetical protein